MATKSYITYTPDSGSGNQTVTVSASEYTGRAARSAVALVVSGTGAGASAASKTVNVTQNGKPEFITRNQESLACANAAGSVFNFDFTTNSSKFTVSVPEAGTTNNTMGMTADLFYFRKSDDTDEKNWIQTTGYIVDDPGKSAQFTLRVKGTTRGAAPVGGSTKCVVTLTDNAGHSAAVTLTQTGATPTISVSTTSLALDYTGAAKTFTITSNTSWSID